jgi:hypothetical protein
LLKKFIDRFGKNCIAGILGDREFIGSDWFKWLLDERLFFYIRIKKSMITTDSRGRDVAVKALFRDLKPTQERILFDKRSILGHDLYITGMKLLDGELLIIVTNEAPGKAIKIYGLRWEIETLFSCLKGRGFNFEDTHIIDPERIKKLCVLLAIAFCWAHKTGEWHHEVRPIKIKTHGRPAVSLFRYGLDYIVSAIIKMHIKFDLFMNCLDKIRLQKPHPDMAEDGL